MFVVMEGVSRPFYRDGSARVYRIEPEKRWDAAAAAVCRDAGMAASPPLRDTPEAAPASPATPASSGTAATPAARRERTDPADSRQPERRRARATPTR